MNFKERDEEYAKVRAELPPIPNFLPTEEVLKNIWDLGFAAGGAIALEKLSMKLQKRMG